MKQKLIIPLLLLIFLSGCNEKWQTKSYYANYFIDMPKDTPQLLFPYLVNTPFTERDAALSPDGQMFIYTFRAVNQFVLLYTELVKGIWTKPNILPFSGKFSDLEPNFSPDGKYLFFSSNRPVGNDTIPKDFDLWVVEKNATEWSEPINLGPKVNSQYDEFYPSVTEDMTLYFCSMNDRCIGGEDLWYSKMVSPLQWDSPQNMGDSINTKANEYNGFIHPKGEYIIFTSFGWGKGFGSSDLWISFKKDDHSWARPQNLGETINSPYFEYCPSISANGDLFFYTSNKPVTETEQIPFMKTYNDIIKLMITPQNSSQNIYYLRTGFINTLRKN